MKTTLLAFATAAVFSLWTLPAQAQYDSGTDKMETLNMTTYESCDSSMTADQCMWSPMLGGNYTSCTAFKSAKEGCVDKVSGPWGNECATVYRNAHCECDDVTKAVKGTCTYVQ